MIIFITRFCCFAYAPKKRKKIRDLLWHYSELRVRKKRPPALRRRRRKSVYFPGLLKLRAAEGAFRLSVASNLLITAQCQQTQCMVFVKTMQEKKGISKNILIKK